MSKLARLTLVVACAVAQTLVSSLPVAADECPCTRTRCESNSTCEAGADASACCRERTAAVVDDCPCTRVRCESNKTCEAGCDDACFWEQTAALVNTLIAQAACGQESQGHAATAAAYVIEPPDVLSVSFNTAAATNCSASCDEKAQCPSAAKTCKKCPTRGECDATQCAVVPAPSLKLHRVGHRLFAPAAPEPKPAGVGNQVAFDIQVLSDRDGNLAEFKQLNAIGFMMSDSTTTLTALRIFEKNKLVTRTTASRLMCEVGQTASVSIAPGDTGTQWKIEVSTRRSGDSSFEFGIQAAADGREKTVKIGLDAREQKTAVMKLDPPSSEAGELYVVVTPTFIKPELRDAANALGDNASPTRCSIEK